MALLVGVSKASPSEELTVVVTGVGTLAYEVSGLTAADTGGGMIETVATVSLGRAHVELTCTGGDTPDEVTTIYACCMYGRATGEMMVECTK